MTTQETYIEHLCKNCANKYTEECSIRTFITDNALITKCVYYKSKHQKKKKTPANWQSW